MPNITEENLGGYTIFQDKDAFCYGTDAVVLADFAEAKPKEKLIDLCSGTGIIPILLCKKTRCAQITAFEIQNNMCELIERSVKKNGLEDRICVCQGDLRNIRKYFSCGSFGVVTCNPPYMVENTGKINLSETVRIARHEVLCKLEDVIASASYLLNSGGRFYLVHRCERLCDCFTLMRQYKLEPKRLSIVTATAESVPSLVLIEAQKDRHPGLIVTKPVILNS